MVLSPLWLLQLYMHVYDLSLSLSLSFPHHSYVITHTRIAIRLVRKKKRVQNTWTNGQMYNLYVLDTIHDTMCQKICCQLWWMQLILRIFEV